MLIDKYLGNISIYFTFLFRIRVHFSIYTDDKLVPISHIYHVAGIIQIQPVCAGAINWVIGFLASDSICLWEMFLRIKATSKMDVKGYLCFLKYG